MRCMLVYGIQGISLSEKSSESSAQRSGTFSFSSLIQQLRGYLALAAMLVFRFTIWNPWRISSPPGFLAPVAAHCAAFGAVWVAYRVAWIVYANFDAICRFLLIVPPTAPSIAVAEVGETYFKVRWSRNSQSGGAPGDKSTFLLSYEESAVEDMPTRYIVEVNGHTIGETRAGETAVRVQKLEPGKLYKVRVWAVGSGNLRTPSKYLSVRTSVSGAERPVWERTKDTAKADSMAPSTRDESGELIPNHSPPSPTESIRRSNVTEPSPTSPLSIPSDGKASPVPPTNSSLPTTVPPAASPPSPALTPVANPADATISTLVAEIDSVRQSRLEIESTARDLDAQVTKEEQELRAELVRLKEARKVEEGGRTKVRQRLRELEDARREVEAQQMKLEREIQAALEDTEQATVRAQDLRAEAKRLREQIKATEESAKRAREQSDARRKELEAVAAEEAQRTKELKDVLERRLTEVAAMSGRVQEKRLLLKSLVEENRTTLADARASGTAMASGPVPAAVRNARQSPHKSRSGAGAASHKRHTKSLSRDYGESPTARDRVVAGDDRSRHATPHRSSGKAARVSPPIDTRTENSGKLFSPDGTKDGEVLLSDRRIPTRRNGNRDTPPPPGLVRARAAGFENGYSEMYQSDTLYGGDHGFVEPYQQRDPLGAFGGSDFSPFHPDPGYGESMYSDFQPYAPDPRPWTNQSQTATHPSSPRDDYQYPTDRRYAPSDLDLFYDPLVSGYHPADSERDMPPATYSILETIPGLSSVWAAPGTGGHPLVQSASTSTVATSPGRTMSGRMSPIGWGELTPMWDIGALLGDGTDGVDTGGRADTGVGSMEARQEEEEGPTWTLDWGTTVTGAKG
ncbi:hypothetical protein M427DRAFT_473223 [Gonapodya prolifera JEL478]|uniref:Fibronectin type-III domain-containing protein n=1 Tax=Gonapodya prolifera (strain JEL478) TaxID=1344416 RepID=A0A139ARA2_GONPJ|nr:hypothetical protein M427DRAFT_473223 [Gonapodya prolifera JEL478]|eukprot:KXS19280.1 hypothetical protein M427DRAFT_473223 [Gonapodya prolifera JEL478]